MTSLYSAYINGILLIQLNQCFVDLKLVCMVILYPHKYTFKDVYLCRPFVHLIIPVREIVIVGNEK